MQTDSTSTALPRIAYTVAEVAQMIGRSKKAVYHMCKRGELRHRQDVPGGNVYIPADALAEWQAGAPRRTPPAVQARSA